MLPPNINLTLRNRRLHNRTGHATRTGANESHNAHREPEHAGSQPRNRSGAEHRRRHHNANRLRKRTGTSIDGGSITHPDTTAKQSSNRREPRREHHQPANWEIIEARRCARTHGATSSKGIAPAKSNWREQHRREQRITRSDAADVDAATSQARQ